MARRKIIGIDEVGRGCLAGPITVAAVAAAFKFRPKGIKDSKQLSSNQRSEWVKRIRGMEMEKKIASAISSVGAGIIDRIGITGAAKLAAGRSLKKLGRKVNIKNYNIFLDGGLFAPEKYQNQKTIIKGDEKIPLVAAASIIAKVHRDRKMARLAKQFPEYGFDVHKGYGTKMHSANIKKHGLCDLHRRSFCRKFM